MNFLSKSEELHRELRPRSPDRWSGAVLHQSEWLFLVRCGNWISVAFANTYFTLMTCFYTGFTEAVWGQMTLVSM